MLEQIVVGVATGLLSKSLPTEQWGWPLTSYGVIPLSIHVFAKVPLGMAVLGDMYTALVMRFHRSGQQVHAGGWRKVPV